MDPHATLVAGLLFSLGLTLGTLIALQFPKRRLRASESRISELQTEIAVQRTNLAEHEKHAGHLKSENARLHQTEIALTRDLATAREQSEHLREQLAKQQTTLLDAFRNLSNNVVTDQTDRILAQHRELLEPLRHRLVEFSSEVRTSRERDISQFETLKAQLESLRTTSDQMREDARNLTHALKSDSKAQGNWGEVVLERILERSGLTRGTEYLVQASFQTPEGSRRQPDILIRLPRNQHLVIDSKVSLTAFVRWNEAADDAARDAALNDHLRSIRTHVENLAAKAYDSLPGLQSPDFVMLFVPVEPAFHIALANDPDLYDYAYDRKIVLVSPTTLLAMLKTVSSIWRREKQDRYALEIAELGGKIHDRLAAFDESMIDLDNRLQQARAAYHQARNRLITGRGSVASHARQMVDLGARARKTLSAPEEGEENAPDPIANPSHTRAENT